MAIKLEEVIIREGWRLNGQGRNRYSIKFVSEIKKINDEKEATGTVCL